MENEIALEVIGFSKKYRGRNNYAVKDSSFVVKKGEFHGFIGANGAGKTTSIKSIIGAYAKFEGKIKIFGMPHNSKEAKSRVGYIPEKADFPKGMSLQKYLFSMANLSGLSRKDAKEFADKKIEEFGLENVRKDSPNSFSSGQKKKVLLAQALVSDPDLIIMDEPAANLDPKARSEFFTELKKLQKEGKTIFLSSHILTELDQYTDHVTILDNGKMVFNGSIASLQKSRAVRYKFVLNDKKDLNKFLKIAEKNKVKVDHKKFDNLVVKLSSVSKLFPFVDKLRTSKIKVLEYTRERVDLQTIYNNFVKFGSVDTPEHLKKVGK